jgi:hypothetical protein
MDLVIALVQFMALVVLVAVCFFIR